VEGTKAVRNFFLLLLVIASTAAAQLPRPIALNPKRIKATESVREGEATYFRGNVRLDLLSLTLYCGELEYRAHEWTIMARRDVQLALKRGATDYTRLDVADVRRLRADEIRQDGDLTNLSGNVTLNLPGWQVLAKSAVLDRSKAMITVHGDAALVALKPPIEGIQDTFGPVFLTETPPIPNTAAAAGKGH
jgi:hypothetical protein